MKRLPIIKKKLGKKLQLNIGCGKKSEDGFIGMDVRDCGQEIVWDVRDGIPFPDNSLDFVWSSHFMEHLTNAEAKALFHDIYRVLKIGGITQHILPHIKDPTAYYFDHLSFWNEERIDTLPGVSGLEGFKITQNIMTNQANTKARLELLFALKKTK